MNPVVGDKFGKMSIVGEVQSLNGRKWPVQCDCGSRVRTANVNQLQRWEDKNTGCRECQKRKTHGRDTSDPTYGSWYSMKQRCLNPKTKSFHRYGGRGITICARWLNSFENFLADMGERPPGKTIDREKVNGNYEPSNCKWATHDEQCANTSQNIRVVVEGD